MTRGRDVFWGIYAAVTPFLAIHCFGSLEKMLGEYASRTYDSLTAFFGQAFLALLLGVVLAVLAVRFFSKPIETSRVPLIGLCIGLLYCVLLMLVLPLEWFVGAEIPVWVYQFAYYTYRSLRYVTVTGFYIVTLIVYWKTHTFLPKEELQKEIEQ